MFVEPFINEKVTQLTFYTRATLSGEIHYTELDKFLWDILEEWSELNVTDATPHTAQERVFWHLIHELKLHNVATLSDDLVFRSEVKVCLDFLDGQGSYPIDCIGWRPVSNR